MFKKLIILHAFSLIYLGCASATINLSKYKIVDSSFSYFNKKSRIDFLNETENELLLSAKRKGYNCLNHKIPTPVDYYLEIPAFYVDREGWKEAIMPIQKFQRNVTKLAELFITTQNPKYVACLERTLNEWADKNALFKFDYKGNNKQAWCTVAWAMTSASMAYSVIKGSEYQSEPAGKKIEAWLSRVVKKQVSYLGGPLSSKNNHANWRGLQAMITGVVTKDNDLFRYGIDKYHLAIQQMNQDGSFPLEMKRKHKSLHYQNFAILPLIYIAEIASRQGYDLYSYRYGDNDIHKAINFLLRAIKDNNLIRRYTPEVQDKSFLGKKRTLNWMEPYFQRFSNIDVEEYLINNRPIFHRYAGGSSTLYFYKP